MIRSRYEIIAIINLFILLDVLRVFKYSVKMDVGIDDYIDRVKPKRKKK